MKNQMLIEWLLNNEKRAKIIGWLSGTALFLAGATVFGISLYLQGRSITPEEDLTLAQGVPVDVDMETGHQEVKYLKFTVAGFRTEYSSRNPKYEEVVSAVESGQSIQMWVSEKQETLLPRNGWFPLYKLRIGEKSVLTYDEIRGEKQNGALGMLICGGIILGFGVYLLAVSIWYQLWPGKVEESPLEETTQELAKPAWWIWIGMSVVVYVALLVAHLSSQSQTKMREVLGAEPLGLPLIPFVIIGDTLFYLPMVWAFWHLNRLSDQVLKDGRRLNIINMIAISYHHPQLVSSAIIFAFGFLYFLTVCIFWPQFIPLG